MSPRLDGALVTGLEFSFSLATVLRLAGPCGERGVSKAAPSRHRQCQSCHAQVCRSVWLCHQSGVSAARPAVMWLYVLPGTRCRGRWPHRIGRMLLCLKELHAWSFDGCVCVCCSIASGRRARFGVARVYNVRVSLHGGRGGNRGGAHGGQAQGREPPVSSDAGLEGQACGHV